MGISIDKQITESVYNGKQLSNKNEWTMDICNNMDESEKHILSERIQMHKTTYCIILFIWYSWKGKTIKTENISGVGGGN